MSVTAYVLKLVSVRTYVHASGGMCTVYCMCIIYVRTCVCGVYVHVCVVCVCASTYMCVCVYAYMCVWCVCVHVHVHVCVCVYVQVYDATKRELDSLKKQLKEAEEEGRATRDKVSEEQSAVKRSFTYVVRSSYSCLGLKSRQLPCLTAFSCKCWTRRALNRLTLSWS